MITSFENYKRAPKLQSTFLEGHSMSFVRRSQHVLRDEPMAEARGERTLVVLSTSRADASETFYNSEHASEGGRRGQQP